MSIKIIFGNVVDFMAEMNNIYTLLKKRVLHLGIWNPNVHLYYKKTSKKTQH